MNCHKNLAGLPLGLGCKDYLLDKSRTWMRITHTQHYGWETQAGQFFLAKCHLLALSNALGNYKLFPVQGTATPELLQPSFQLGERGFPGHLWEKPVSGFGCFVPIFFLWILERVDPVYTYLWLPIVSNQNLGPEGFFLQSHRSSWFCHVCGNIFFK